MIKIERKKTTKADLAIESLEEAKRSDSGYNTEEVNIALQEMFFGKCYICEKKGATSYQIEHLRPHKSDYDLKYDWNNLFLACAHCNNTKLAKYDPILDCTKSDVDQRIAFRKDGFFGTDESFVFEALDDQPETKNTVELLKAVHYGTTPQKKMEAKSIRRELRNQLSRFKNLVRDYEDAEEDYEKEDYLSAIKQEVSQRAEFAAFKRWILWDNREKYAELIGLCGI